MQVGIPLNGWLLLACLALVVVGEAARASTPEAPLFRLYDGVTLFVDNPDGRAFKVSLDIYDLNTGGDGFDTCAVSEMLFKVSDPNGKYAVREVVPDDGVVVKGPPSPPRDWYKLRGVTPPTRWSVSSDPNRLAAMQYRTVTRTVPKGARGVYRILLVGTNDLYVRARLDPALHWAVATHDGPQHGHGDQLAKSYIYIPRGATALYFSASEPDRPQTRRFTLRAPDGTVILQGTADELQDAFRASGRKETDPTCTLPTAYQDQLLTLEVSQGAGDYLVRLGFFHNQLQSYYIPYGGVVSAVYAPDAQTARAVQGGAIYHDGLVFWYPFQVRYHDWLKKQKPEDFVVRGVDDKEIPLTRDKGYRSSWYFPELPTRPNFLPLCGPHIEMPLCDRVMHDYPANHNKQALWIAIQDLFERPAQVGSVSVPAPEGYHCNGFRNLTIGDHTALNGPGGALSYHFGAWGWPYWRAAWRIVKESDAPREIKDIIMEGLIVAGDRLAFARNDARTNGNAYASEIEGLRYCVAATDDPLQKKMYDTSFNAFVHETFGERTGIGPSGDCQETLGHDNHYGTYILSYWQPVVDDLHDPQFRQVMDRIVNLYSYIWCRDALANPWSSRTHHSVTEETLKPYGFVWKGDPGDDFTVNVNDGSEWFAVRRPNYYVVTYHGRLAPRVAGGELGSPAGLRRGFDLPAHRPRPRHGAGLHRARRVWRGDATVEVARLPPALDCRGDGGRHAAGHRGQRAPWGKTGWHYGHQRRRRAQPACARPAHLPLRRGGDRLRSTP